MTQAPATPSLVERVKEASYGAAQSYLNSTPWRGALRGDAFLAGVAWVISDPGFAALEAQQARIAELEKALTWIALFAETRGRDRDRTAERADRDLLADVANRLIELDRDLEYAYAKVQYGFEHGSFDFSILRQRAALLQATGGENGR